MVILSPQRASLPSHVLASLPPQKYRSPARSAKWRLQLRRSNQSGRHIKSTESDEPVADTVDQGLEENRAQAIRLSRRTLRVTFTCNKCGARTERLVNPLAWEKGLVFAQCKGCEVWHKLRDEAHLIDEIIYADEE